VLQGRVMIFWDIHLSALPIHVFGTRESRGCPMHVEQQSVGTIYRESGCLRNGDNDLRAPIDVPGQSKRARQICDAAIQIPVTVL
jgi:hypothetical protein